MRGKGRLGWTAMVFGCLAIGTCAAVVISRTEKERVSLTVLGYVTNELSAASAEATGERSYICAIIGMTNRTSRPVTYSADVTPRGVNYEVLQLSAMGWHQRRFSSSFCAFGRIECSLAPSAGVQFQALILDESAPCKVQVYYDDGRAPSKLWNYVPGWLAQRLAWLRKPPRATTASFSLTETRDR